MTYVALYEQTQENALDKGHVAWTSRVASVRCPRLILKAYKDNALTKSSSYVRQFLQGGNLVHFMSYFSKKCSIPVTKPDKICRSDFAIDL